MSTILPDQENRAVAAPRRVKRDDRRNTTNNGANPGKRTVLGCISNNIRRQPSRAAKQNTCIENKQDENTQPDQNSFGSSTSSQTTFVIHEDKPSTSIESTLSFTQSSILSAASKPTRQPSLRLQHSQSALSLKADEALSEENDSDCLPPSVTKLKSINIEPLTCSPDVDMSICEDDAMSVSSTKIPREEALSQNELFDVSDYGGDIYNYLREAELCHRPRPNYMLKQADITANMRWILVDWLVEVSEEYNLQTETLFLAVSYIDRFLSHMSVKRDKLQLVGTTAMFIASKYEEIYPPDVSQFAYITDNTYKVGQILRMEHLILKVLSFDMAVPTAHVLVTYFCSILKCSEENTNLALFLAELSMLDCDPFLRYLPSLIAASAIALANHTKGRPAWPEPLQEASRYTLKDLQECYVNLHRAFCKVQEPQQHAIRDKYRASKWLSVSLLSPRENFPW